MFCDQLLERHTKASPYVNESLPYFSLCSVERKKNILGNLKANVEIYDSYLYESSGQKPTNPSALLWRALQQLELRPSGSLFSFISPDDVIEIHLIDGTQIFRNLAFFDYCSYSLEELYCCSWNDLYSHSSQALAKLMELDRKMFLGEIRDVTALDFGSHIIKELRSPLKYQINAKMKYLAPLFGVDSRAVATIVIEEADLLVTVQDEEFALKKYYEGEQPEKIASFD